MKKYSKQLVEVWGDTVAIGDLLKSLFICTSTTMGAYFLAPNPPPFPIDWWSVGCYNRFYSLLLPVSPEKKISRMELRKRER